MNPVRWKYTSLTFLVISVVFLGGTLVLPSVRSPQQATYNGPAVPYYNASYTISGYYIPSVSKGTEVNISFTNFIPRDLQISVFPTRPGDISPVPGNIPIFDKTLVTNFTLTFNAQETQPYGVYVISYDNTTFVMRVSAVYSPYDWMSSYSVAGVLATFATSILFYYYIYNARRWQRDQRAIREALAGRNEPE